MITPYTLNNHPSYSSSAYSKYIRSFRALDIRAVRNCSRYSLRCCYSFSRFRSDFGFLCYRYALIGRSSKCTDSRSISGGDGSLRTRFGMTGTLAYISSCCFLAFFLGGAFLLFRLVLPLGIINVISRVCRSDSISPNRYHCRLPGA